MNKINKTTNVIRGEVLKSLGIEESSDGLWAYASVECPDAAFDIVRIAGIDYTQYHNPPDTHLKILAQHLKVLPDGSPPVIGRVEQFRKVLKDGTPALAFYMTWAVDGSGKLTELAAKYKDLFDGGYLDSFSIGSLVMERKSIKDAGYEYTNIVLYEISAVTIPANAKATTIKALEDTLSMELDWQVVLNRSIEDVNANIQKLADTKEGDAGETRNLLKTMEAQQSLILQKFEQLDARLDYLESSIVIQPAPQTPKANDTNDGVIFREQLKAIKAQIDRIK